MDSRLRGIDVSSHQGKVNWATWWTLGKRFAFIKATEGTSYLNPLFQEQYDGSAEQGFTRGTYHFALPHVSSGAAQATFFVENGGDWSADGSTLPGALDIEYNPYGTTCYGLSKAAMVKWIHDFADTYHEATQRYPVVYTTTDWWESCTGNSAEFSHLPLWVASYSSDLGKLPASWSTHTFWQYSDRPVDLNVFNGYKNELTTLANRKADAQRRGAHTARALVHGTQPRNIQRPQGKTARPSAAVAARRASSSRSSVTPVPANPR